MKGAYVGLGSNIGDRAGFLGNALELLSYEHVTVVAVSSLYETAPVGGPPQEFFLNACASILTTHGPAGLLQKLLAVENKLGRVRRKRWGPRTVDLDLLLYGEVIMRTPLLELPHPRLAERDFVMIPLAEIAPGVFVPGRDKTVAGLLAERPSTTGVSLYRKNWLERS